MNQSEKQWDKLLKIKTSGRDDSRSDTYHYPYEPTPYTVLERLAQSGWIGKKNVLVDYGCGKGRVDFFLSFQTRCRTIGIEYDSRIYDKAMENQKSSVVNGRTAFECILAENYQVKDEVDSFYFFNPFSVEILMSVVEKIIDSYYENPRDIQLLFYYPSDEYIYYLMNVDELMFDDEIDCRDLFDGDDSREKVLKFVLG